MTDSKEIKVKEKQEVTTPAEQTIPGLVFTPEVDIFETDKPSRCWPISPA